MLTHIHHINFVLYDLQEGIEYFNKLFSSTPELANLAERKVKTAKYKIGETFLVLVQPTDSNGVVADVLKQKGEGIFLISFATESIDEALQKLECDYKNKRQGIDGWSISDLSPEEKFGAILQLTEAVKL
jgi:methylmalonyl-CoA/ethylmalonyl-CoA epimerase